MTTDELPSPTRLNVMLVAVAVAALLTIGGAAGFLFGLNSIDREARRTDRAICDGHQAQATALIEAFAGGDRSARAEAAVVAFLEDLNRDLAPLRCELRDPQLAGG